MTPHPCPIPGCNLQFHSLPKLYVHLALCHEIAKDGGNIPLQSIKSLETCKDRVYGILKAIPSTRSNDQLLYLYYIRYWGGQLVYDEATKNIQFRNREGMSVEAYIHMPSYETCRRSRQYWQEHDPEVRASELVQIERGIKQQAYRDYFVAKKLKGYMPNTYVPSGGER